MVINEYEDFYASNNDFENDNASWYDSSTYSSCDEPKSEESDYGFDEDNKKTCREYFCLFYTMILILNMKMIVVLIFVFLEEEVVYLSQKYWNKIWPDLVLTVELCINRMMIWILW